MKQTIYASLLLAGVIGTAQAAVTAEQAQQLGTSLTPLGAEIAGNAAGTIPAWTGGLGASAGQRDSRGALSDPFADEQPLFVVTNANKDEYRDVLTAGQIAMLERYPDSYQIPVYTTHRTFSAPEAVYAAAKQNATQTKLVAGGSGLENFSTAYPFPMPDQALEVLWNHITRYRGGSFRRHSVQVTPLPNGSYVPVHIDQRFTSSEHLSGNESAASNILFYYKSSILSPARLAGNVTLVHETIDQVSEPRMAWIYNSGQRRVRRAPQVAYDGPYQASDGLLAADNLDIFNGAPDRYDWELIGKREVLIPYNSYRLSSSELRYDDVVKAGHINPKHTRYELHRVWEIRAKLKDNARHIYAERHFVIDEDSWQIVLADHYDDRGALWRVGEGFQQMDYDVKVGMLTVEVLNDLMNGRYIASGMTNEESAPIEYGYKATMSDYTPAALRNSGVR
tara:strand:+ start:56222 stop:57574 length:1353 start_codon:yes stop_codon:yes gene_type:complete